MLIPDGIWIGLPHANHVADPALGSDDLKALLLNPVHWHGSQRNPVWKRLLAEMNGEANPKAVFRRELARRYGECVHVLALEPDAFDERYFTPPPRPDFPSTKDEIAAALIAEGHTPPAKSKLLIEFEAMARMHGLPLAEDWDVHVATIAAGRQIIPESWREPLALTERVIKLNRHARRFLERGMAEVSMFWTDDDGHRYRVRFDYLRRRTVADVKTYDNKAGGDPVAVFSSARERWCYDLQAVHYMEARINVLPRLVAERKVWRGIPTAGVEPGSVYAHPATADDLAFLDDVAAYTDPSWWWVTISTGGIPEVDTIEFPKELAAYGAAKVQLDQAKQNYRDMRERFGPDDSEMWIADRGLLRFTDLNFSRRSLDRGAVLHDVISDAV